MIEYTIYRLYEKLFSRRYRILELNGTYYPQARETFLGFSKNLRFNAEPYDSLYSTSYNHSLMFPPNRPPYDGTTWQPDGQPCSSQLEAELVILEDMKEVENETLRKSKVRLIRSSAVNAKA